MAITYEVDRASVEYVKMRLGAMGHKAPQVLRVAINRTAKQARRELSDETRREYTIKNKYFNQSAKIFNATNQNLEATIKISGGPLDLTEYKVKPGTPSIGSHRPDVYSANVKIATGFKKLIRPSDNQKAFVAQFSSGHKAVAERVGKERLPLRTLKGPSVPSIVGNENTVYGKVKPVIQEQLQHNIDMQIKRVLDGK